VQRWSAGVGALGGGFTVDVPRWSAGVGALGGGFTVRVQHRIAGVSAFAAAAVGALGWRSEA
jgi:hypothetical protein